MNASNSRTQRLCLYGSILTATIGLGLLSRSSIVPASSFIGQYAGDTLWAMAVYWAVALVFSGAPPRHLAIAALGFSFAIELSQLYQTDWINQLRSHRLGALVLGHGFLWSDLFCYTVGVIGATVIDVCVRIKKAPPNHQKN